MAASTVSLGQSRGLAADANSLGDLKALAGRDQKGALKEAAKQFEALFMRELLKSMREATMKSGLLDSEAGDLGADLLDQQYATQMSGLPGGLSEMIERQLSQQIGTTADTSGGKGGSLSSSGVTSTVDRASGTGARQQAFVSKLGAAAQQVAQESGIPASYMIGQAGHETGWGRSEIKTADGGNSFNVFGIKAGKGWTGKVAEVTTTEYIDGKPRKVTAKFRAYDSYEDSFKDYARLINDSPRYEKARAKTHSAVAFAAELQKAGYATDPQYASKLSRAIQSTHGIARSPLLARATGTQA